nr:uncharacterized protein LOC110582045 [Neomonachus schauinslandi]
MLSAPLYHTPSIPVPTLTADPSLVTFSIHRIAMSALWRVSTFHSTLFAQDSQWNLFEHHFSKARQLVKRTNASLFGSHGFVRFLECHVLMLQKMPEGVFMHTPPETRSQTLKYCEEFFSRCVTCPVYHQWVSELKASIMRYGKRESMSSTNIVRPFDTCLTRIWIEGEFLEENNSFGRNLGIQRFDRVADVKENKDEEEIKDCIC